MVIAIAYHALIRILRRHRILSPAVGRAVNDREWSPSGQVQIRPGSNRSIDLGTGREGQSPATGRASAAAQAAGGLDRRSSQHGGVKCFFSPSRNRTLEAEKLAGKHVQTQNTLNKP